MNYNTGLITKEKSWDGKKYQIKGNKPEAQETNKCLAILKTKILSIYNALLEQEPPISIDLVKHKLLGQNLERKTLLEAFAYHNELLSKGIGVKNSKALIPSIKRWKIRLKNSFFTSTDEKIYF